MPSAPLSADDRGALIARVVPDVTGLDKQFDYSIPAELRGVVSVGSIVRVPLGPRRVRAWVVELLESSDVEQLKPLAAWVGIGPDPSLVALSRWAAHRWAGRLRALLHAASPTAVVKRAVQPMPMRWDPSGVTPLEPQTMVLRVPPASDPIDVVLGAAAHGPTLVCCPAVDLAAQLAARLHRAGLRVALLPRDWARAAGGVDVVIGARAAVWGPCTGLRGVVVLDEHDESLQEERNPTWHARDVALERCRRAGVPCWLVSPCPTVEAVAAVRHRIAVPSRVEERMGWPIIDIVNRGDNEAPVRTPVTRALLDLCRDPAQRVVLVLNTKGRARRLVCGGCRAMTLCAACGAGVSQTTDGMLHCARCGAQRPAVCHGCGSTRLSAISIGVSRLGEELGQAVRRQVVEVTADTDRDDIEHGAASPILLGTEAVLHRVRSASVVAFVDFDDELLAPRFRAAEHAMGLLVRAARLVGSRASGGRIVVQTFQPHHEVVQAALHADPGRLIEPESRRRHLLSFPPFGAVASVSGTSAGEWLREPGDGLVVSGPAGGRWLVRAADWDTLADGLELLGPRPRGVRIEVNPPRL